MKGEGALGIHTQVCEKKGHSPETHDEIYPPHNYLESLVYPKDTLVQENDTKFGEAKCQDGEKAYDPKRLFGHVTKVLGFAVVDMRATDLPVALSRQKA